jgi:hypothetical protein
LVPSLSLSKDDLSVQPTSSSWQPADILYSGVAVGSSIGHAIGGFFGGGSSAPAEQPQQSYSPQATQHDQQATNQWGNNCAGATQNFTKCMDENNGNMQICNWYLEQLKACQAAASQY